MLKIIHENNTKRSTISSNLTGGCKKKKNTSNYIVTRTTTNGGFDIKRQNDQPTIIYSLRKQISNVNRPRYVIFIDQKSSSESFVSKPGIVPRYLSNKFSTDYLNSIRLLDFPD